MLLAFIQSNLKAHLLSFFLFDLEGNVLCLSTPVLASDFTNSAFSSLCFFFISSICFLLLLVQLLLLQILLAWLALAFFDRQLYS